MVFEVKPSVCTQDSPRAQASSFEPCLGQVEAYVWVCYKLIFVLQKILFPTYYMLGFRFIILWPIKNFFFHPILLSSPWIKDFD